MVHGSQFSVTLMPLLFTMAGWFDGRLFTCYCYLPFMLLWFVAKHYHALRSLNLDLLIQAMPCFIVMFHFTLLFSV